MMENVSIWLPVSGMTMLTVAEALGRMSSLTHGTRESEALCARLVDRLRFLSEHVDPVKQADILPLFSAAVDQTTALLKKFGQKKALQNVVSSRAVREGVQRLHTAIDEVFVAAGLGDAQEMTAWGESEAADIEEQLTRLTHLVSDPRALVLGLSASQIEEALANLELEITQRSHSVEFQALLERAFELLGHEAPELDSIPNWYVSRDDVEIGKQIDIGSFGAVHRAKWGSTRTNVCAKLLFTEGADAQYVFLREAGVWHHLSHPNVIPMLGGCHVGTPLFFMLELATKGNFATYFRNPDNNIHRMWQRFHEAAQGLAYLHKHNIVHANIRCTNILVGDDNKAKLCDFGFDRTRALSLSRSVRGQVDEIRWFAPECVLGYGVAACASFASDVFSLGMSIIEAKTGKVPWFPMSEDMIIDEVAEGNGHPRPDGVFTDAEWKLVQGMTVFEVADRLTLARATEMMSELAQEEARLFANS